MKLILNEEILKKLSIEEKKTDEEISRILKVCRASVTVARKRYKISKTREYLRKNLKLLNSDQISVIDGSILGDGGIEVHHKNSCVLSFGHSMKQIEYAKLKANMLGEYISSIKTNKVGFTRVRTIVHPIFENYRKESYGIFNCKNYKKLPKFILDRLNNLSLSIWYCDDGSWSNNQVWFCIGTPIEDERNYAKKILEDKFNLKCSICKMSNEECWRLYILKKSQEQFFKHVYDNVIKMLPYKIPKKFLYVNQHPSLIGNDKEGSETSGSLNSK